MPQILIEYTSNLEVNFEKKDFFLRLHKIIQKTGNCKIDNCKSRLRIINDFYIGELQNNNAGFIHLELRFLEGRDSKTKSILGNEMLLFLLDSFQINEDNLNIQITVNIIDIERDSYFKHPKGTLTNLN